MTRNNYIPAKLGHERKNVSEANTNQKRVLPAAGEWWRMVHFGLMVDEDNEVHAIHRRVFCGLSKFSKYFNVGMVACNRSSLTTQCTKPLTVSLSNHKKPPTSAKPEAGHDSLQLYHSDSFPFATKKVTDASWLDDEARLDKCIRSHGADCNSCSWVHNLVTPAAPSAQICNFDPSRVQNRPEVSMVCRCAVPQKLGVSD